MALAGLFTPSMLAFTGALQGLSGIVSFDSDVEQEVARQQAICDEITQNKLRLDKINKILGDVTNLKNTVTPENDKLIAGINDDISASINKIRELRNKYKTKLYTIIIINIIVITILLIYIVNKASQ